MMKVKSFVIRISRVRGLYMFIDKQVVNKAI